MATLTGELYGDVVAVWPCKSLPAAASVKLLGEDGYTVKDAYLTPSELRKLAIMLQNTADELEAHG